MTQNNYLIAITGNIGSGKSTVLKTVNELGFPTLSLDEFTSAAYELQKDNLIKTFGKEIIKDGKVDRKTLAKIVFGDSVKRKLLNELHTPLFLNLLFARQKNTPFALWKYRFYLKVDMRISLTRFGLLLRQNQRLKKECFSAIICQRMSLKNALTLKLRTQAN